ncbi:MAG: hypothetical protein JST94_03195 [Bacteroidetes bacterium]|nr:hypothetical protein [Bacteroidota bacterium]MBS1670444.1 hypothetical protein [Bacteroidota bacterium]
MHKKIIIIVCSIILFSIQKINAQLDLSFNNPVLQTGDSSRIMKGESTYGTVKALAEQADGKIIIGGDFTTYNGRPRKNICRVLANGNIDDNFLINAGFEGKVNCIVVQADGKIVVGGDFTMYNSQPANRIIRLNENGTIDNSFQIGFGFNNNVECMALQPDGKILVGGYFTSYNGKAATGITRLNENGTVDNSFNVGNFIGTVHAIAFQKNKILLGGIFRQLDTKTYSLIRLTNNGSKDLGFNLGGEGVLINSIVKKIVVQPDNKIILIGNIDRYNTTPLNNIVRLGENGWIDKKFNPGQGFTSWNKDDLYDALVDKEGNIYVAGGFKQFNNTTRCGFLRLHPDGSLDKEHVATNIFEGVVVNCLLLKADESIIAGGNFTRLNNYARNSIAAIDKDGLIIPHLFNVITGFDGTVQKIIPYTNNTFLAAGNFRVYNSRYVNGMICIDGNGKWSNKFLFPFYLYKISKITDIKIQSDGKILVAGDLINIKDNHNYGLIRLQADGKPDEQFYTGGGFTTDNGYAYPTSIALQKDNKIIVGGTFTKYDGVAVNGIIRLNENGTIDNSFKTDYLTEVKKIMLDKDENILVLGRAIIKSSGKFVSNIIRYNSSGAIDTKFNFVPYADAEFTSCSFQNENKILLGGYFKLATNERNEGLLRLNLNGTIDASFQIDKRIGKCGEGITDINVLPDNSILVSFSYKDNSNVPMAYMSLIKLNASGLLQGFLFNKGIATPRNDNTVTVASTVLTTDNKIIVAGGFNKIDDYIVRGIAKIENKYVITTDASNATIVETNNTSEKKSTDINFIKQLKNQNPLKINLITHPNIKDRIKKLLGKDYDFFLGICEEGSAEPIQIKNNYGYFNVIGKSRSMGHTNVYFDFVKNLIYVVIGSSHAEDKPFIYTEDATKKIPIVITSLFN